MLLIWGTKRTTNASKNGYFNCSVCQSNQPYKLVSICNTPHVWYISIGTVEEVMQFIGCQTCKSQFNASHYKISEENNKTEEEAKIATWDCPQYKFDNPNSVNKCKICAFSLV